MTHENDFSLLIILQGVEVDWYGRIYFTKCRKEVILSSGTLGSPHILMHSGIGAAEDLTQFGVSIEL